MKKLQLNNKGFGVVGILVIIVALVAVGGAGAYVWHHNHKAKTVATTTSSSSSTQTSGNKSTQGSGSTTGTQQTYLTIKEWGVRIKPAVSLPSMTYTIDNSGGHQWAVLAFKDLPSSCAGAYYFSRAMAGQDIDGYGTTPEKFLSIDPTSVKKVGDYYYYLGHGQAACAPESATVEQNDLIQQITGKTTTSNTYGYSVEAIPNN